jgi:hypothetical protein
MESRGIALLCFYTSALGGGKGSASCPRGFLSSGKTQYPLYRRLGAPQGWSGQVRKISPPLGFNPRTVQPVTDRKELLYTAPTVSELYQRLGNIQWIMQWLSFWDPHVCYKIIPGTVTRIKATRLNNSNFKYKNASVVALCGFMVWYLSIKILLPLQKNVYWNILC